MEFAALALTAFGLTLAWFLYRFEQLAGRHRDLDRALAVLRAVEKGMTDPSGWGGAFFEGKNWDVDESQKAAGDAIKAILAKRWNQVFPVPTESLVLLIGAGELLRDETIAAANHALWRLHVFNQLVRQQAEMIGHHAVEIASTTDDERREALCSGFAQQAFMLHHYGIGAADVPGGGWYRALKDAVRTDIDHLASQRERGFFDYAGTRRGHLLGDLGFPLLLAAVIAAGVFLVLDDRDSPPDAPPATTSTAG